MFKTKTPSEKELFSSFGHLKLGSRPQGGTPKENFDNSDFQLGNGHYKLF
jgi:hypothetical protein